MMLNKAGIRRFLLEYAKQYRAHQFTRVADGVFDQLESAVREKCRQIVQAQPSKGKTIR